MRLLVVLLTFSLSPIASLAQSACEIPADLLAHKEHTIFSEAQESDLGDAIAEEGEGMFRVVKGPQNDYLREIAARLIAQLPKTGLSFTFNLIESDQVNAFTLPGGRIYVTRKLITQARNEDEVAAVLAHEVGHAFLRHPSAVTTKMLEIVLGVTNVGDRKDIYEKMHLVHEQIGLKSNKIKRNSIDDEQDEADIVSAYLIARAGYRPEAHAELWNRIYDVKGKTGNAFTDFFGATRPDQKRLRNIQRFAQQLPEGCHNVPKRDSMGFGAWQAMVLADDKLRSSAQSSAVLKSVSLAEPIRPDLDYLRFSPDGQYLLAQDEFGIHVLGHKPFKWLFRIEAPNANPAQFSTDSKQVIVSNDTLRIEQWDVARGERSLVHEVHVPDGCAVSKTSPDGRLLACIPGDLSLKLIDTATSAVRFQLPKHRLEWWQVPLIQIGGVSRIARLRFTEDGSFLAYRILDDVNAVNTSLAQKIRLPDQIQRAMRFSFDFQGSDRFLGVNGSDPKQSALMTFPEGRTLASVTLAHVQLQNTTRGDYAIVWPVKGFAVGLLSTKLNKLVLGNKLPALDAYFDEFVSERRTGELGLYNLNGDKMQFQTGVDLPPSDIFSTRYFTVSSDLRYVAFSTRSRGAIWDLATGKRTILVRGFERAFFRASDFIATYPLTQAEIEDKYPEPTNLSAVRGDDEDVPEKQTRIFARVMLDTMHPGAMEDEPEAGSRQHGDQLVFWRKTRNDKKKFIGWTIEIRDFGSKQVKWSRLFRNGYPYTYYDPAANTLVALWGVESLVGKAELEADPDLRARAKELHNRQYDYVASAFELSSGRVLGKIFIDTGKSSFDVFDMDCAGGKLAVADYQNHILVYSLQTGQILGRVFGDRPNLSPDGHALAVRTELDTEAVYDTERFEQQYAASFPSWPVAVQFTPRGDQLVVLTGDQTIEFIGKPAQTGALVH